jgi:hypothetical protein
MKIFKTLIKTKLIDENHIEVRDYELFKQPLKLIHCVSENYKLCNHLGEDFMLLSLAQQNKGKVINTQQSKFPPYSYYKIYKFLWKPQHSAQDLDENPTNLANILNGLSSAQIKELRHRLGIDKQDKRV